VIYDIRHITTYRYAVPVASAACVLRLLPRDEPGQTVLDSGLEISPNPAETHSSTDAFGNRVATVRIDAAHRELRIAALSRISVNRQAPPAPGLTPAWEQIRNAAQTSRSLAQDSPAHFLYASRQVALNGDAAAWCAESFAPNRPMLEAAVELMGRIRRDFKYEKDATEVTTTVAEAFASRKGVCQDFAHVMIAGLRGLGLPAAYVSGYIRTLPPPGKPRLEGADASHAWVSVWCGPEFGWLGLDPTNDQLIGDDHVVVARGRDYADVSPIDGVFIGSGDHELSVSVDVKPEGA
jgi:transglutaminase-like putative cysteine protease